MLTSKSVDLINIFVLEIFSLFCRVALKILVLLLKNKKGDPFLSLLCMWQFNNPHYKCVFLLEMSPFKLINPFILRNMTTAIVESFLYSLIAIDISFLLKRRLCIPDNSPCEEECTLHCTSGRPIWNDESLFPFWMHCCSFCPNLSAWNSASICCHEVWWLRIFPKMSTCFPAYCWIPVYPGCFLPLFHAWHRFWQLPSFCRNPIQRALVYRKESNSQQGKHSVYSFHDA